MLQKEGLCMIEIKSVHTRVTWGGDSEIKGENRWNGGVREVYVIHYVKKGAGFLEVKGKTFRITAGQSFIIYPDTDVKYYPDEEDPWEYCWIDFVGITIKDILSHIDVSGTNPVFPAIDNSPEEIFIKLNQTLYDNKFNYQYRTLERLSCLYAILSYYSEHYSKRLSLQGDDFFDSVLNYINNNYISPEFSISSISAALHIDRSTLFRLFRKKLDKSPIEYINELRIRTATTLLTTTEQSVRSIALEAGFNDPLYFSRFFKQRLGCSPSDFRINGGNIDNMKEK